MQARFQRHDQYFNAVNSEAYAYRSGPYFHGKSAGLSWLIVFKHRPARLSFPIKDEEKAREHVRVSVIKGLA